MVVRLKIVILFVLLGFVFHSCTKKINASRELGIGIRQYEADSNLHAIKTLSKIISITDTCSECFLYRAFAFKEIKDYESALNDLYKLIQLDTSEAYPYANRATIFYLTKDYKLALADFQKALELSPNSTDLYNPISHMLFANGKLEEACEYYKKALEIGDTTFNYLIVKYCNKY